MRIVAGELKGRRLLSPRGELVRPTSDRMREALFSILGDIAGLEVLDIFCGTGALGIEALSRGASRATLVDTDIRPARANVDALDLGGRVDLERADAQAWLAQGQTRFDLILCDPPYRLAPALERDLATALPRRVAAGGRLAVEREASGAFSLPAAEGLELEVDRRYGRASLRVWRRAG